MADHDGVITRRLGLMAWLWTGRDTSSRVTAEKAPPARRTGDEDFRSNLDIAWRTHGAQENWTGKVDTKASIFLALDTAVLGAVVAARTQRDGALRALDSWQTTLLWTAIAMCLLGAVLAAVVVFPILGRPRSSGRPSGTIYFGDLRRWEPDDLAQRLANLTAEEQFQQVSRQLVTMARVAWLKHRLMQVALGMALAGFALIFIALVG